MDPVVIKRMQLISKTGQYGTKVAGVSFAYRQTSTPIDIKCRAVPLRQPLLW